MEVMVGKNLALPVADNTRNSVSSSCTLLLHLEFSGFIHCGVGHRLSQNPSEINVMCCEVN